MSHFFIDRPIFATVLSIVITLTGFIALLFLPIAQYPRITPPGIAISIQYPGANAQEVADSIAAPIEQQVNGVEGMLYMSSNSGNDGSYTLTVTFDIGTDVNSALVMVQNRVTLALPQLPTAAQNQGITIRKRTPDMLMIVNFISPNGTYDDKYLSNFATIYAKDELLRVDGVSDLNIFGQRDYSMRVWVDPMKLAARNMTVIDVANTITNENVDAPVGRVGQPPVVGGLAFQYPMNTVGRLVEIEEFQRLNVKVGGSTPVLSMTGTSPQPAKGGNSLAATSTSGTTAMTGMTAAGGGGGGGGVGGGGIPNTSAGGTYLTNAISLSSDSAVSGTLIVGYPPAAPALTDINQSTSFPTSPVAPAMPAFTAPTIAASAVAGAGTGPAGSVGALGLTGGANGGPTSPASALVKLSDVARLELGAQNYNTISSFDNNPSVGFGLYQLPGTNALEVADRVRAKMEDLKKGFPPDLEYRIAYDTSLYVRDSVNDVIWTLGAAIAIVAIVVMVFLQSWRAAIIPLIAIPVSVLGTFAAMFALGFSLNNISLFGLVLAIGIVVDDAIVVVENVERWLEHGLSPKEATYKAMGEVTGPIIAVALVLCAVFVPCAFIEGITGQFFRQFAITIAVSTVISTVNSLTFSPAMAAILLKPKGARRDPLSWVIDLLFGWFFWLFNKAFGGLTAAYSWSVGATLKLRLLVLGAYAVLLLLTVMSIHDLPDWLTHKIVWLKDRGYHLTTFRDAPKGFIPAQDQGRCIVNVQLPDAASLDRTYATVLQVERVTLDTPGVGHTITNAGMSFLLQANSPNFAAMFVVLKPFEVRQKGWFRFSDKEFEAMRKEGLPEALVGKLDPATMTREQLIATLAAPARVPRAWDLMTDALLRRRLKNKEYDWEEFNKVMDKVLTAEERAQYQGQIEKYTKQTHPKFGDRLSDVVIMEKLRMRWAREKDPQTGERIDAQVAVFPTSPIPGLGSAGGFKFVVEDRGGRGVRDLEGRMDDLVDRFKKLPYLADAKTQFRANIPQLYVDVDRVKAMALGVSIDDINNTLIMYLGSLYVTSYNAFGRHWQVTIQAEGSYRNRPEGLYLYQIRNSSGQMVPLSTLVTLREVGGPITVNRYNLYTSGPIQGNVLPGKSDGEAIDAINRVADETLPLSMRPEWTELMFLQIRAGNTAIVIFILSIMSVFLALSALYESWALPLAVILVVPLCLLCSVWGTVDVAGKDVNIFVQIGLVVLVGLACKNAILIVEFAKQLHQDGRSVYDATREASRLRLRPILMTSFAFIFGVMPLMFAAGAGAEMRRSLGTAVFSGMLGVTLFGIFITPVFYYIIQNMSENKNLQALPFASLLAQAGGAFLGAAMGYLLSTVNPEKFPLPWVPVIGGLSGALIVRGFRGVNIGPRASAVLREGLGSRGLAKWSEGRAGIPTDATRETKGPPASPAEPSHGTGENGTGDAIAETPAKDVNNEKR